MSELTTDLIISREGLYSSTLVYFLGVGEHPVRKSPKVAHAVASDAKSARTKTVEKFTAHTFPAIHWQFLCTWGVYLHGEGGLPEGRAWRAVFARAVACLRPLFSVSEGGVFSELNGQPASSAAPRSAHTGSGMGKYLQPRS
jgi:hypothetical protein